MNPWGFIAAAYLTTAVVLVALIAWVAIDRRVVTRRLVLLEAQGVRRRSAAATR